MQNRLHRTLNVLLWFSIALHFISSPALADKWDTDPAELHKGVVFRTKIDQLHPTQFAAGMLEVRKKMDEIEDLDKHDRNLLSENDPTPVVVGPDRVLYMVDNHHGALARAKVGHQHIYAVVVADWHRLTRDEFWKKMIESHYVYLYDENGVGPLSPDQLPDSVTKLKDDPFRSLAGLVRKNGGFTKNSVYFNQFMWGQYFREAMPDLKNAPSRTITSKAVVERATQLAKWEAPRTLPGALKFPKVDVPLPPPRDHTGLEEINCRESFSLIVLPSAS